MAKQPVRRVVSVPDKTYAEIGRLKAQLESVSGRRLSLADVIDRGLEYLADAHSRGAWLSPREAAPLLDQRHRQEIFNVVVQLVPRINPKLTVAAVAFDPPRHKLNVQFLERDPIAILTEGVVTTNGD